MLTARLLQLADGDFSTVNKDIFNSDEHVHTLLL